MALDGQVVIDEADRREPDDEEHQGETSPGELELVVAKVRDGIAEHRGCDDGNAAHRRRAGLARVRMGERSVVADELTDPAPTQRLDEERRPEDGGREGDAGGDEQRDH